MDMSIKGLLFAALLAASTVSFASVNVNTADARSLDKELAGVGKVTAEKIVEARKTGEFRDMKDMQKRVSGFGAKLAAKNQSNIRFKD
jgi:competence ComEA-like helix-hairpin-helix protein